MFTICRNSKIDRGSDQPTNKQRNYVKNSDKIKEMSIDISKLNYKNIILMKELNNIQNKLDESLKNQEKLNKHILMLEKKMTLCDWTEI